ncbi:MAG TPA: hypothetical protein VKW78_12260 [Terriglobales bacterium]|nr:hypothetical protein [Terriglobales bacterium]
MPDSAPVLRASLPDLNCAAARIAAVVGPVALVMWNMRKIHFSHSCKTAAARTAVKGAPLSGAFIGAKRRPLTATAAEATRRQRAGTPVPAPILCFQQVYAAATLVTPAETAHPPILFLAADSIHVDARKHVNASVYAVARCMALIPFTFPQSYRAVTLQLPFGGDVSLLQPTL